MPLIAKIEDILYKGYKDSVSIGSFILKETGKGAKCKKANFKSSNNVIVYKFDKELKSPRKDKFPFFNDGENYKGLRSMCDYIMFYKKTEKYFVIICNIKSDNKSNNASQLKAGKIFSEFITNTVKRINNVDVDFHIKEVLFSSKQLYKSSTNPRSRKNKKRDFFSYLSNDTKSEKCDLDLICI